MTKWKIKIVETSNNVYKLVKIHKLGSVIEKTETNIEVLKSEAHEDSIKLEKQIQRKIKN